MKRRAVLTAFATGVGAFAGCMGNESDGWGYRTTCDRMIIPYWNLPDNARSEVDTAFADGEYETDGNLYYELLLEDTDEQYLVKDRTYYLAEIDETKESSTLQFHETTPSFDSPHPIEITNKTEEILKITFTIGKGDGPILTDIKAHEREVSLRPPEVHQTDGIIDEFGTYTVKVAFDDGRSVEEQFGVGREHTAITVAIADDELSVSDNVGSDDGTCPWAD